MTLFFEPTKLVGLEYDATLVFPVSLEWIVQQRL